MPARPAPAHGNGRPSTGVTSVAFADFQESEHPRADDGKFSSKPGGGLFGRIKGIFGGGKSTSAAPAESTSPPDEPPGRPALIKLSPRAAATTTPDAVQKSLASMFGPPTAKNDPLARLHSAVGAPPDAQVEITDHQRDPSNPKAWHVSVKVSHPKYNALRIVGVDEKGNKYIHNVLITVDARHRGDGLGAELFDRQVREAGRAGFKYLKCQAGGSGAEQEQLLAKAREAFPGVTSLADVTATADGRTWVGQHGKMNGYYTWPRFGYDEPLDGEAHTAARARFPKAKTVLDVLSTAEGRKWWQAHGETMNEARFDLTPGSRSMKVLEAYRAERAARKSTSPPTTKPPSTPPGNGSPAATGDAKAFSDAQVRAVGALADTLVAKAFADMAPVLRRYERFLQEQAAERKRAKVKALGDTLRRFGRTPAQVAVLSELVATADDTHVKAFADHTSGTALDRAIADLTAAYGPQPRG